MSETTKPASDKDFAAEIERTLSSKLARTLDEGELGEIAGGTCATQHPGFGTCDDWAQP